MATLKDVALEAGVAISTVSRAFSHPHLLSGETVTHVRTVAERLNYRPNPLAKALITGHSRILGLLVPDLSNPFMTQLLKGAQAEAKTEGYWLMVADTDEQLDQESVWVDTMHGVSEGLILGAPRADDESVRAMASQQPTLVLMRAIEGLACMRVDSRPAEVALVDQLTALGHRHVAYAPGPQQSWEGRTRLRQVSEICADRRLQLTLLAHGPATVQNGADLADQVVRSGATAVMCFDDVIAHGVVAGLQRAGHRVPDDFSVTGHDDELPMVGHPSLTSTTGRARELGRAAARRVLAGDFTAGEVVLTAEAVIRESTGPAPR